MDPIRLALLCSALVLSGHGLAAQEHDRGQEPPTEGAPDLSRQEWLLSRAKYSDYEKATFNFGLGIRDDPELKLTRNNWDIEFGNNSKGTPDVMDVGMVRDDTSTIADLGAVDYADLDPSQVESLVPLERVPCVLGHLYLVHTMDGGTNRFALFRVIAHKPGDSARINWVAFDPRGLRTSPGLAIEEKLGRKLSAYVEAFRRRGGLDYCLRISDEASEKTFDRLSDPHVKNLPTDFGALLDRIAALPEVKVVFARSTIDEQKAWRAAEVPYDVRIRTLREALEITTRALRLSWVVRTDGALVIRRA